MNSQMPNNSQADSAIKEFQAAAEAIGLVFAGGGPIGDGKPHRTGTAGKENGQDGFYVLHVDPPASGFFQNNRTGESCRWTHRNGRLLSAEERAAYRARALRDKETRAAEQARQYADAAQRAQAKYGQLAPAQEAHPYLRRKGIPGPVVGVRVTQDGRLVVPVYGDGGKIESLQFIDADGAKLFMRGGRTRGGLFALKGRDPAAALVICEGLATGVSIYRAMGGLVTVLVGFFADNLRHVAQRARKRYPDRAIVVACDNDRQTPGNPGVTKGRAAAAAVGGLVAVPDFVDGGEGSDFNDLHQTRGLDAVAEIIAAALADPAPQDEPTPPAGRRPRRSKQASAQKAAQAEESLAADVIRVVRGAPHLAVDPSEAILASDKLPVQFRVFQRGGQLVRVAVLPAAVAAEGVTRPAGSVVVLAVEKAFMLDALARFGNFAKFDARADGWKPCDPPASVVEAILARAGLWPFPVLRGVVACPAIRADGSLALEPGFDALSGFYFAHELAISVPDAPGQEEAKAALDHLAGLLTGFSFVEPTDYAVALALILTAVARPGMVAAPIFVVTAPVRGSGKSTLIDVVSVIATGRRAAVLSATSDPAELEKRLVGCLLAGDAIVSIDNLNGVLKSDLICQAVTAESVKIRPLCSSVQIEAPNAGLWAVNGNNVRLAEDLSRRALQVRLDPGLERPEERSFAFDPLSRAMANRADYVASALTVMRAYAVAGRPDMGLSQFGSFQGWAACVRSAMAWAGAADPCESRKAVLADDPEAAALRALFGAWLDRFGRTPRTVREIVKAAEEDGSALGAVVEDLAGEGRGINAKRLGWWLRRHAGRIINDMRLVQFGGAAGVVQWQLLPASE